MSLKGQTVRQLELLVQQCICDVEPRRAMTSPLFLQLQIQTPRNWQLARPLAYPLFPRCGIGFLALEYSLSCQPSLMVISPWALPHVTCVCCPFCSLDCCTIGTGCSAGLRPWLCETESCSSCVHRSHQVCSFNWLSRVFGRSIREGELRYKVFSLNPFGRTCACCPVRFL